MRMVGSDRDGHSDGDRGSDNYTIFTLMVVIVN